MEWVNYIWNMILLCVIYPFIQTPPIYWWCLESHDFVWANCFFLKVIQTHCLSLFERNAYKFWNEGLASASAGKIAFWTKYALRLLKFNENFYIQTEMSIAANISRCSVIVQLAYTSFCFVFRRPYRYSIVICHFYLIWVINSVKPP